MTALVWVRSSLDGLMEKPYMGKMPDQMGSLPLAMLHLLQRPDAHLAFGGGNKLYGTKIHESTWMLQRTQTALKEGEFAAFEDLDPLLQGDALAGLHDRVLGAHIDMVSDTVSTETVLVFHHAQRLGASEVIDVTNRRIERAVSESVVAHQQIGQWPKGLTWTHVVAQVG